MIYKKIIKKIQNKNNNKMVFFKYNYNNKLFRDKKKLNLNK